MPNKTLKTILLVFSFSIAMGFLESSVVIYLRELYYSNGFDFPIKATSNIVALTELLRELATIIMLLTISIIAGRNKIEQFAYFLLSFAIWDIFYYVFLKLLILWPDSLFTWDVLFLIPTTWVGPVIAPIINSITMIVLSLLIIYFIEINSFAKFNLLQWLLLIGGSIIVIIAYTEEYVGFMLQYFSFSDLFDYSSNKQILEKACQFIPHHFKWEIFFIGVAFHILAIYLFFKKNINLKMKNN